ncbi:MAG: DUF11 domain-containing protein, partial [Caldilineaceae bacterium]|nr:DUF11 domain-containing protein [Caldilineaceae bacterium]
MSNRQKMTQISCAIVLLISFLLGAGLTPATVETASAQGFDLGITTVAPTYVTAGGTITYELVLQNLTNKPITNIGVFDPLPANTTYVSGGAYFSEDGGVEFQLASLAAHAKHTFSLVVKADNGLAAGSSIVNTGIQIYKYTIAGGANDYWADGAVTTVEVLGTVVAILKHNGKAFDVNVHGFQFENFDNKHTWNDDLEASDVFNFFGPGVCESGTTAATCKLTTLADTWRLNTIKDMGLGHCDGMASASLSLFTQQEFNGISTPGNIQSGAANTINLNFPGKDIENYIVGQMAFQYTEEYWSKIIAKKPSEIVAELTKAFNASTPVTYELTIEKTGKKPAGHAITPYGIEKVSASETRILVYDNNYPKQRQYVTVNTANDTWRYTTAATPGQTPDVYTGTATSKTLKIVPNSFRTFPSEYFQCTFCPDDTDDEDVQAAATAATDGELKIQYVGEGAILVINDEGQRTGDDPDTQSFVDEIPDTQIRTHRGGLGKEVPPTIVVPFSEVDDTFYKVIVHGETVSNTTSGSL